MVVGKSRNATDALTSAYNRQIRPLLDAIDRLRHLNVIQEDVEVKLPTVVVVGDQSTGKSSVLESLSGISLPRGHGVCTRVPLIMRLHDDPSHSTPELYLEYLDKKVTTSEQSITEAINSATDEIAGNEKAICCTPLTLVVKKRGLPNLTMVDLPGITRAPVHAQQDDLYEQISKTIMEFISPPDTIILHVLSACLDFHTCESTRILQQVDKTGEQTLAVVTMADRSLEDLLEKVDVDAANIGLGYVCVVRNRTGDETYEQARAEEVKLFQNNPHLSKIDKSIIGIPALARQLMRLQAARISKCLPDIVRRLHEKFDLISLLQDSSSLSSDDIKTFTEIISSSKDTLRSLIIRTSERYELDKKQAMGERVALTDLLIQFAKEMPVNCPVLENEFLMDEIHVLEEIPDSLGSAFQSLLESKIKLVSDKPFQFVDDVWLYVEGVVLTALLEHSDKHAQLQPPIKKAIASIIEKKKKKSTEVVEETVEKEKTVDYTSNPDYMKTWYELMQEKENFMDVIQNVNEEPKIDLNRFGVVEVGHLRKYSELVEKAYDMKMRLTAYWKIVITRMVDELALHILHSLKMLAEEELETELMNEVIGAKMNGDEVLKMEELPLVAGKKRLELVKEPDTTVTIHDDFGLLTMDTPAEEDSLAVGKHKEAKQQPIERPIRERKPISWLKDFIY